jgi:hypothetical protein
MTSTTSTSTITSAWDQLHARNDVINHVIMRAEQGHTRLDGWTDLHPVWDHFDDAGHLLRDLQQRWFHSLAANIDNALESGEGTLADDVRRAYRTAAAGHVGLRRILDAHADHPALQPLVRREHALIAGAAGVASVDEVLQDHAVPGEQRRRGLLARLFLAA